ncbi:hypothetical protein [Streptomyces sp. 1222.5]
MDTSFFYPAEDDDSVAYHKSSAMNGDLAKIEDVVPWVRHLLTDGWWVNGQTPFPSTVATPPVDGKGGRAVVARHLNTSAAPGRRLRAAARSDSVVE